jgi:hypothetical protein
MSTWDFRRENTATKSGANNVAGILAGYQPFAEADNIASKRNVIATSKGWVRRQNKTDLNGNKRTMDEVLVAAAPGSGLYYNSNTYLGKADIAQMYIKLNANNVISANVSANLYIVFNGPIKFKNSGNAMSINIANTIGGNHAVARFTAQTSSNLIGANNTLIFTMPKLQGGAGSVKATYHINAQAITVAGMPLYNPEQTTTHSANVTITGAVANNLLNFAGTKIINFQVSPKGV